MRVMGWLLGIGVAALAVWFLGFWFPHRSPGPRVVSAAGGFSLCIPNAWTPKEQPDGSITAQSPEDAGKPGGPGTGRDSARLLAFTLTELQVVARQTLSSSVARLRGQYSRVALGLDLLPDPRLTVFLAMELPPTDPSEWGQWPRGEPAGTGLRVENLRLFESVPVTVPAASGRLVVYQMQGPQGIEAHLVAVMEKSNRVTVVDLQTRQTSLDRHRRMADRILGSFRWVH